MRVVLLNQYYAPAEAATAQLLSDVGEALVARGHRVSAVCSRRSYPDPSRLHPARETIGGVAVHRTWTTGFGRGSRAGRLADYLTYGLGAAARLLFQARPDVIVSLTTPPMVSLLGLTLARLRRAGSLFWVMDVYPELAFELGVLDRDGIAARVLTRLSRASLRGSSVVVTLGETMADTLGGLGARRVHVVHNWADEQAITPCPVRPHALRTALGWDDRLVVLYSGNMGLAHEFDTVLDAAEQLRERQRILFAFVGGGPRLEAVREAVARRELGNVCFLPHVPREQLGESLTAGDVHLITLRSGLPGLLVPSKIYGILAAGRPSLYVGPPEGEVPSILRGAACGTCVEPGDARGLAGAILRYEADPELRAEEGRRARRVCEERYSRRQALERLVALVEQAGHER